ncbi:helix-turn-helix domain-containing protein [Candidatus Wolfebacteria bacterium]|nr:helix-turn-helix domain-containing protein [Candidatus Wolfebacteria bacterium]
MTQDEAFTILKTGANVFLTGEPGSGKTYLVNQYVAWLRGHGIAPAITASTGIAATHIGGMTIHSWIGIGIKTELTKEDLRRIKDNRRVVKRITNSHVLIIDEISMLSARTFAMVDAVCHAVRGSQKPFGGLQIVLVGDFFQLPPVVRHDDEPDARLGFGNESGNENAQFAYASPTWTTLDPTVCYLSEQHRQEDAVFLEILSAFRAGVLSEPHVKYLSERRVQIMPEHDGITRLFSHNADVHRLNECELAKLSGETHVFDMEGRGNQKFVEQLKRGCLSPETLDLKIGAKVMFTKNSMEGKFVNGTTGTVAGFHKHDGFPIVETLTGKRITAEPTDWSVEHEFKVLASIRQIPLRLAWAITVHKSQGMSLDAAVIDLAQAFEYGQGYVAISRVRTLAGLHLTGLNDRALQVHPDILAKDADFRTQSAEAMEKFHNMEIHGVNRAQETFIVNCGGSIEISTAPHVAAISKPNTYAETRVLAKSGKTVKEIAAARTLTEGTIISHLEKLRLRGELSSDDVANLVIGQETAIEKIHVAMKSIGAGSMKPIFEYFEGRISYDLIRLARLLFEK